MAGRRHGRTERTTMFETGIRQFRMAMGMVSGRRLEPATSAGWWRTRWPRSPSSASRAPTRSRCSSGPLADPEERLEFARRGLRRTARRLAAQSPFYARRFAAAHVEPGGLDVAALRAIPVTTKRDLIERPGDFRCADVTGVPGDPHHRHHRPAGRDLAVPVRDGAVVRARRAGLGAPRRAASGRRHAGQHQLPRDRRPCTWPPPSAAWPVPGAGCSASCRRTRPSTASPRAGRRSCRPTPATSPSW